MFATTRSAFDFRYIVAAVRSNLWLIAAIIAAAIGIAVVATMLQTPRYTASSTIQINDTSGRVLNQEDQQNESIGAGYDIDRFLKTQVDVLKSRGLALRVAQKLKLMNNPRFYASEEVPAPLAGTPPEALRRWVGSLLLGHMTVDLPRDSRIVTIRFESTDPQISADVANAYASEFIQSNLQRKYDSSAYARNFIGEQLAEAKQRVESSERALNDYSRQAGLIRTREAATGAGKNDSGGESGQSVTTASLLQLNQAANEATGRRIEAESRWRANSTGQLLSAPEVVGNGAIVALLSQKATVEAELNQERANHLAEYPTVRAKQAQLAALDRQIQTSAQQIRSSVRASYLAAADAEKNLARQVNLLKGATLGEQEKNVQYGLLAREAETNRQVYDGLLQRFKELNASAGISLSNVSIIDNAEVPGGPSSPNLLKNLMVALILGVGLAALTVFVKDQFDDSIRVPEDVEPKLGLPLLGVVPRSHSGEPDEALVDPKSPISEAYNSLRGSLLYSTVEGLPHVMLVTSAQPSEGKTTSSFAIASGFARMGKRVLLIDADLRRPSLHRRTGYDNERGLSTLLTSHEPIETAMQPSGQDYLSLLPSGPVPPSPTELLSTARIEEILQEAARRFEVVVIDSPPILGLADSPLMSALVDGVVFVVEADRSRRGSLKTALRRLRAMRPVMLGAVLTKFDPLKAGNRYSEYYGYEYYQYESSSSTKTA
ncbi:MAG: polysaccharide biosynthesis tyrosine autokinase [Novosphingobium sp.]|nr:polysaccharide biosynthesis tyrosine autokinase [Novosphingobium sp.]